MATWRVTVALLASALLPPGIWGGFLSGQGVNGGLSCFTCTFGVAMLEQMSEVQQQSEVQVMGRVCGSLPSSQLQALCRRFADMAAPLLTALLQEDPSPDAICQALGFCNTDPDLPVCRSIPLTPGHRRRRAANAERTFSERVKRSSDIVNEQGNGEWKPGMQICDMKGVKELCQYFQNSFRYLIPPAKNDMDRDFFGTSPTLRGSAWRGKDCNDTDPAVHPGAIPIKDDITVDSNCNGIYGVNPESGEPYEKELCEGTHPRGVAVLGDSMSAHFHLPEAWFDPTRITKDAFKHWHFIVENELDWPHMSSITGLGFNQWPEAIQGPMDSVYLKLRQRNRCNHKDYQNIAINGANAQAMADLFVRSLSRNRMTDRPLIVFYAMLGMDVCNEHADNTVAYMTKPADMRRKALETLRYLDWVLPANSTVFLMGLAEGHLLYEALHDRVHPVASQWKTFTYSDLFDFQNCLQVSSCAGWMNTNATVRKMTAQRAKELSTTLKDLASTHPTFKHFDVHFMDYPLRKAINMWRSKGGQTWQLLDPVDGFHSNQRGQALLAKAVWEEAERIVPGVFGPPNPHNPRIADLFGDQGPYF